MRYSEKIKYSDIILSGLKAKDRKIKSTKARIFGIIFSIMFIVFTLISVIIKLPKIERSVAESSELTLDTLMIVIALLAIFTRVIISVVMVFMKKSLFKLNHMAAYELMEVFLVLNLIIMIIANIYNYYTIIEINKLWEGAGTFMENFKDIFLKTPTNMLIITGILIIDLPAFLKFMAYIITNAFTFFISLVLTIIFPVTLVLYLVKNNRIFYEYEDYDKDYYLINKRYVRKENYGISVFIRKSLWLLVLAGFFFLFMLASHDIFHAEMTVNLFFEDYFPYIITYCYVVSLLFALEWRMDRIVVRLSKNTREIKKNEEEEDNE